MQGPPPAAQHLLVLARSLAAQKNHRLAALSYAAAAKAPGTSTALKARLLYRAASHLFRLVHPPREDLTRAIQFLQKCSIILKSQPDSFDMRMQALALLEKVYTKAADASSAAKTARAALDIATAERHADAANVLHWWVYFRCRDVRNAFASGDGQRALQLASESATECERYGDSFSAVAFQICVCQAELSLPPPARFDVWEVLHKAEAAIAALASTSKSDEADLVLLTFGVCIMQGLAYLRTGDLANARKNMTDRLRKAYNALRQLQRQGVKDGMWNWLPSRICTALTFHVMAVVHRGASQNSQTWVNVSIALAKLGIKQDTLKNLAPNDVAVPGVSSRASCALAVALLDSAARFRMAVIDLQGAHPLAAAAVNVAFPDDASKAEIVNLEAGRPANAQLIIPEDSTVVDVVLRCAALLVCAEYHFLRGRVSAAHISTQLVQIIKDTSSRFRNCYGLELASDTWQMAQSYQSLLTGAARPANIMSGIDVGPESLKAGRQGLDSRFFNKHVLAMAWFSVGIFHMRANDVLEARQALKSTLNILQSVSSVNEQIVANAMISLSGLVLTHANIDENATEMIATATTLAQQLNDSVTLVRASRQNKKLAVRLNLSHERRAAAEAGLVDSANELASKQDLAILNVVSELL